MLDYDGPLKADARRIGSVCSVFEFKIDKAMNINNCLFLFTWGFFNFKSLIFLFFFIL